MWGTQLSPSPWCCPGNLVKVTDLCRLTLLPPSQQVLSTFGDDDEEEEGSQVLAWDQAAVPWEPMTPLRQLGSERGRRPAGQASRSALVTGCGGAGLLVAVCGRHYHLPSHYLRPTHSLFRACALSPKSPSLLPCSIRNRHQWKHRKHMTHIICTCTHITLVTYL